MLKKITAFLFGCFIGWFGATGIVALPHDSGVGLNTNIGGHSGIAIWDPSKLEIKVMKNYDKYLLEYPITVGSGSMTIWRIISLPIAINGNEYYITKNVNIDLWSLSRVDNFEKRRSKNVLFLRPTNINDNIATRNNTFNSLESIFKYIESARNSDKK